MVCQERVEKGRHEMRKIWFYDAEEVEPPEPDMYECPVCGEEIPYGTDLYFRDGECVGCENCITTKCVEDYWVETVEAMRENYDS